MAQWDAVAQVYVGGQVARTATAEAQLQDLMDECHGGLAIFGYGSLCWNPGSGSLAHESVQAVSPAEALGYRRCWAQKSADHRGVPHFPGIVCTLLQDDEVAALRGPLDDSSSAASQTTTTTTNSHGRSRTEGVLYLVPPPLVEACLAELDFREKGGYARDIIRVTVAHHDDKKEGLQQQQQQRHALLYRGTPDNPALWLRALNDLPYAAAVMAVSVGPSVRTQHTRDYVSCLVCVCVCLCLEHQPNVLLVLLCVFSLCCVCLLSPVLYTGSQRRLFEPAQGVLDATIHRIGAIEAMG